MTRDEATDLAVRITQCFNTPPIDIWEQDLATLNHGRAGTTLARLRREHEQRWLSIAAFMTMYRALNTDDPSTLPPDCEHCDNTAWVEAPNHLTRDKHDEPVHRYTQVQPCHCPRGRDAEQTSVWKHRGAA